MLKRNRYLVDHAACLLAVYNGERHLLFEPADRGTTMTVSVIQEQIQQNIFHHTLTAYMVGYAQEKGLWIENMADESVK